jgi:uncharacterized protein (TIGR03437 family)
MPKSGRQTLAATVVKLRQQIQQIKERKLIRITFCGILLALSQPALRAQGTSTVSVGWYNGDCQSTLIGSSNWYRSNLEQQFTRVYDEFVVPSGGWTVTGVFSNNLLYNAPPITQASWEIRSGLSVNNGGTVMASGVSPAIQTYDSVLRAYRIQVDGLQVQLAAGDYQLSVVPLGTASGQSYVCETQGQNAIGSPAGNGKAFRSSDPALFALISAADGTNLNFSQGVLISGKLLPLPSTSDQWRANVDSLVQQMPALHSLPFPGISLDDFKARAADLRSRIPALSGAEIRTGLLELVAAIQDSHTDVTWPWPSLFRELPISFYWFDDGIYVTAAAAQYQNLLGGRLVTVGQTGVDEATRILAALVPHENDQWLKKRIPQMELTNADYLFGKGLIGSIDSAPLQVQTVSNGVVSANIQTYANSQGPPLVPVFQGTPPLSRQHLDRRYWATVIEQGATVYFQYNSCFEDPTQSSADFFKQLDQMMAQSGVERVILDMRNNSGGDASILSPWVTKMQASRFNQPGRLYVVVGRATFSAAMEASNHLRDRTAAIFVGEPTGAKPQFLLRVGQFALPYSGIKVSYSNGVEAANDPGPTLIPDIRTGLTFQDYMNGIDPALNAILSIPAPGACAGSYAVSPATQSVAAAGGTGSVTVTALAGCAWTAASNNSWITVTSGRSGVGGGTVSYSVAANNSSIPRTGTMTIAGQTFTITQAALPPFIAAGGVVNAASYTAPITPGGIAALFGSNLAGSTTTAGLPLRTVLGGVAVTVNGVAAPLYFVSPQQINFQVPWELLGQAQASFTVAAGGQTSLSQTVAVAASPALFAVNARGNGQGAILVSNSDIAAAPVGSIPGRSTRPAIRGEFLSIYCTGLGDVKNRPANGAPPSGSALASTVVTPSVSIGGAPAAVVFSGLAPGFVGLYQVNVQVPNNTPSGSGVPVVVTLAGTSSNTVTIAVQ